MLFKKGVLKMKSFLLIISFLFSIQAFAKNSIKLAAGDWAPFLKKKGLAHQGVGAHIVTSAFDKVGVKVKFKFMPWAKGMTEAKKGKKVDGAILWLKKTEREAIFEYSKRVMAETNVFFHLKSKPFKCVSTSNGLLGDDCMKDIAGKKLKVGGILKFSYSDAFDKAVGKAGDHDDTSKAIIKSFKRERKSILNFKKLLKGKIDIYPQEINVGYYELNNELKGKASKVTHFKVPLQENPSYLIMPKKNSYSKGLVEKFNKGLQALKDSGEYSKMLALDKVGGYKCEEYVKTHSEKVPGC
jgi:polar amino acid transport system substrate-binding protein